MPEEVNIGRAERHSAFSEAGQCRSFRGRHWIGMTFGGEASSEGSDDWAGDNNYIDDAAEGLWMMPFYNNSWCARARLVVNGGVFGAGTRSGGLSEARPVNLCARYLPKRGYRFIAASEAYRSLGY